MSESPRFFNGFVDGADLVLLYRDAEGCVMARRRPAEWSSFYRLAEVTSAVMRDLRGSKWVAGLREEGEWLRVRWRDPEWRRKIHVAEFDVRDEATGKWETKPGYFAGHGIRHFEADVDPVRRFFSETGALVAPPRRAYVDIETDSRVPPAIARKGKARVLAWTIVVDDAPERDAKDASGIRVVAEGLLAEDTDDAERALLAAFWKAAEEFDQLAGWFGDIFDFPILRLRADIVGAPHKDFRRWLYVDQAEAHERMNRNAAESGDEKESLALDHVARELVGEGKHDFDAGKTWEAWAAGGAERRRMLEYCVQDTKLLPRVERKTGYLALNATMCELARCFQETRNFYPIPLIDGFLLRMGVEDGVRFPTKPEAEEGTKFAGAFVMEPKVTGIRKNVHVIDFSGMYPSIMRTWNMSPETRRDVAVNGPIEPGCCRAPSTRAGFVVEPIGFVPKALKICREQRKVWSKKAADAPGGSPEWFDAMRRSNAWKVFANTFFGGTGSPFCRFHDRIVAESTSQNGVWLIQKTIHAAEQRGMSAVYGDTDSAFFEGTTREEIGEFVRWCNAELYPKAVAETGCRDNYIDVAYEKEFERVVFVGKKRYAAVFLTYKGTASCACDKASGEPGAIDVRTMTCRNCGRKWDALPPPRGKPEVKGLEYKRGDANRLARVLQRKIIDRLLRERCEDPAAFVPLVEEARRHVLEDPLPIEEVRKSQSLSKNLREYEKKLKKDGTEREDLAHVKVAKILKERGEQVEEGVKIAYYVVDASTSPMEVRPAADYDGNPDRHYLWEHLIYPATQRVLEAAFPAEPGMSGDDLRARDWGRFAKTRPRKARAVAPKPDEAMAGTRVPAKRRLRGISGEAQADLFALPVPIVRGDEPFVVDIVAEDEADESRKALKVKAVLRQYPGERPVAFRIRTASGEKLGSGTQSLRVAVCADLLRDVAVALAESESRAS